MLTVSAEVEVRPLPRPILRGDRHIDRTTPRRSYRIAGAPLAGHTLTMCKCRSSRWCHRRVQCSDYGGTKPGADGCVAGCLYQSGVLLGADFSGQGDAVRLV
jgi:hypothetical protein